MINTSLLQKVRENQVYLTIPNIILIKRVYKDYFFISFKK